MLDFISITTGKWKECCYIVFDSHLHSIIIDPGDDFELINSVITNNNLNVQAILCTHAHFDHIASVSKLKDTYKIPFYLHRGDFQLLKQANFYRHIFQGEKNISLPTVDVDLANEKFIKYGEIHIQVIDTPGHTEGGVSFLIQKMLFVGDNICNYKIGTSTLPGGNKEKLIKSIKKILTLQNPELQIFSGHGKPMLLSNAKKLILIG